MEKEVRLGLSMMWSIQQLLKKRTLINFQQKVFMFMDFSQKDANGAEVDLMIVTQNKSLHHFQLFTSVQLTKRRQAIKIECLTLIYALSINIRKEQIDTLFSEQDSLVKALSIPHIGNLEVQLSCALQNERILLQRLL